MKNLVSIFAAVAHWLVSTAFILWGWSVAAPHLNAPMFTYWEVFAMRMALSHVMAILWQKPVTISEKKEED